MYDQFIVLASWVPNSNVCVFGIVNLLHLLIALPAIHLLWWCSRMQLSVCYFFYAKMLNFLDE